jgi:hypothetical protein
MLMLKAKWLVYQGHDLVPIVGIMYVLKPAERLLREQLATRRSGHIIDVKIMYLNRHLRVIRLLSVIIKAGILKIFNPLISEFDSQR